MEMRYCTATGDMNSLSSNTLFQVLTILESSISTMEQCLQKCAQLDLQFQSRCAKLEADRTIILENVAAPCAQELSDNLLEKPSVADAPVDALFNADRAVAIARNFHVDSPEDFQLNAAKKCDKVASSGSVHLSDFNFVTVHGDAGIEGHLNVVAHNEGANYECSSTVALSATVTGRPSVSCANLYLIASAKDSELITVDIARQCSGYTLETGYTRDLQICNGEYKGSLKGHCPGTSILSSNANLQWLIAWLAEVYYPTPKAYYSASNSGSTVQVRCAKLDVDRVLALQRNLNIANSEDDLLEAESSLDYAKRLPQNFFGEVFLDHHNSVTVIDSAFLYSVPAAPHMDDICTATPDHHCFARTIPLYMSLGQFPWTISLFRTAHKDDRELQLYFAPITELAVRNADSTLLQEALPRLPTDSELHPLVPYALYLIADVPSCSDASASTLSPSQRVFDCVLENQKGRTVKLFNSFEQVFSAVSGLELSMSKEHHKYVELPVACIILICLFALQHYGTHRVGFLFAPIVIIWLLCISSIGVYNIFHWNPQVYQALSPYYMYKFLKKTQKQGWMSLGGILLCITGSEAMFADLGHFSQLSIQIAFTSVVYPSLILAYMGQAAYLSKHHIIENNYQIGFYVSVPERLRWPVLAIAILAAVVGSQAIITGTFSIIKQCSALGCFPRVKIIHTSSKMHGQIYIPEINWILMFLCLAVTIGFRDTKRLGNASGLAVITVMLVTTSLMSLVIVLCWHKSIFLAIGFILLFGFTEALYFSASLIKFREGAWVPIALSFIFMIVMYVWHYGTLMKYEFDVQNKVSINWLLSLGPSLGIVRVRGIGLVHTELVSGIPAIFSHFVTNLPAFHQILVFLCIKSVPVPYVHPEERFLVGRIGPKEYRIYRCIVRYGYHDIQKDDVEFERDLVCSIAEFIRSERLSPNGTASFANGWAEDLEKEDEKMTVVGTSSTHTEGVQMCEEDEYPSDIAGTSELREIQSPIGPRKRVRFVLPESPQIDMNAREELQELMEARESGMAFIIGHSYVKAQRNSSLIKRLVINFGYDFLRRNSRGPTYASSIPHASTLEVGMVYVV